MLQSPKTLFAQADLHHGVLLPEDAGYQERQDSHWSSYAKAEPACIVRPVSAQEVSAIVKILVGAGQQFAVRSGGHAQWYGANNIKGGVQIDLCFLDWVRLEEQAFAVDIGPGALWMNVYSELQKHGHMVAGGRDGKVGVGGLLLGGGKTFFSGSRGFACDDVLAYEIVLADGRILNVDADNYSDLFLTLKGGSGNFGIVTNFKMRSFKCDKVWAGLRVLHKDATNGALQALQDFTKHVSEDADSNLMLFLGHMVSRHGNFSRAAVSSLAYNTDPQQPDMDDVHPVVAMIQVAGTENASAYKTFLDMPAVMDTTKLSTIQTVTTEYDPVPSGYYNCFFTLTVKNDVRILQKAAELHDQFVGDLAAFIPDKSFLTECLFQPLPKLFGQLSKKVGGNIMGVSDQPEDGILFVAIAVVKTSEQETYTYPKFKAWGQGVRDFAKSIENGLLPWVYMNYADPSQDPLTGYGLDNVEKIKAAAAKYDPDQVFQKLCPGGFKISKVKI